MPGRSPRHRSTPPRPHINRSSPGRSRVHSPVASSGRGRARRGEYQPTVRRMRSPLPPKRRSYSPPIKRKRSSSISPVPEREISRRQKLSKSPVRSRSRSRGPLESDSRPARIVSGTDRFRERDYEEHREGNLAYFRGPEGSIDFDINEMKKYTIEIVRKPSSVHEDSRIIRSIINADEIAPVRRPDEGTRPMFQRLQTSASKDRSHSEEYKRIFIKKDSWNEGSRDSGSRDRAHSRESPSRDRAHSRERPPTSYSPRPGPSHHEDYRRPYYHDRERACSPGETRHRSPYRDDYVERRDKHRESHRRGGSREYTKRDSDGRKREERRYSPERRRVYERDNRESGSDLRSRINEKRSDPHSHIEERDRERHYESDVGRHGRPPHFSPPHERRRHASPERHEGLRDQRGAWERDRERGRRDQASTQQASDEPPAFHGRYDESRRPPSSYKPDYEPRKFFKSFDTKESIPPPVRGRGLPTRRDLPPNNRGRWLDFRGRGLDFRGRGLGFRGRGPGRGMQHGFRGGMMASQGTSRGAPFVQSRGFSPRKY